MGKVQRRGHRSSNEQIPKVKSKIKQKWVTEDILELMKKRRQINNRQVFETLNKEIVKNVLKPKRIGSTTKAERLNYTTRVLSRQCTETLENPWMPKVKRL